MSLSVLASNERGKGGAEIWGDGWQHWDPLQGLYKRALKLPTPKQGGDPAEKPGWTPLHP